MISIFQPFFSLFFLVQLLDFIPLDFLIGEASIPVSLRESYSPEAMKNEGQFVQ